jgi:uncharacterized protein involved in exopolysaccharide biosynthesis
VNYNSSASMDREAQIDLIAVWRVLLRYKFLIGGIAACSIAAAVVFALLSKPVFLAETVVTEVRDSSMSGAGSLASQLGGLASLAGVNIGNAMGAGRESQAMLKSRYLVEEFIKRNRLEAVLAEDSSDPPTLWQAVRSFRQSILKVREDTRQNVTTVQIEWKDPAVAASWANGIVALANDIIRARALDDAQRNISYLNSQIVQTNVLEVQRVMYNLIENETKTLMLANARKEYAFTTVDPAVAPELRIRPRRTVMVLLGAAFGLMLGMAVAFVHNAWARSRNPVPAAA